MTSYGVYCGFFRCACERRSSLAPGGRHATARIGSPRLSVVLHTSLPMLAEQRFEDISWVIGVSALRCPRNRRCLSVLEGTAAYAVTRSCRLRERRTDSPEGYRRSLSACRNALTPLTARIVAFPFAYIPGLASADASVRYLAHRERCVSDNRTAISCMLRFRGTM